MKEVAICPCEILKTIFIILQLIHASVSVVVRRAGCPEGTPSGTLVPIIGSCNQYGVCFDDLRESPEHRRSIAVKQCPEGEIAVSRGLTVMCVPGDCCQPPPCPIPPGSIPPSGWVFPCEEHTNLDKEHFQDPWDCDAYWTCKRKTNGDPGYVTKKNSCPEGSTFGLGKKGKACVVTSEPDVCQWLPRSTVLRCSEF